VRRLSQRTPLRIKLITALLTLVVVALAAISFASLTVLRNTLTSQDDPQLTNARNHFVTSSGLFHDGGPTSIFSNIEVYYGTNFGPVIVGIQQSSQITEFSAGPRTFQMTDLPDVPTGSAWISAHSGQLVTVGSLAGNNQWRVIVEPVTLTSFQTGTGTGTGTLVIAANLGNINSTIRQLAVFEVIVGTVIVFVLAIVGVAVVRANLQPLDEIEETAEEIAEGHLELRVPEHDPRTEVGSLGRSLNIMLDQIQTAFRARQESEAAALQSEERMRRFIADASHELRTPLTAIRGFAEYYRQRGGIADRAAVDDEQPTTPSHEQVDFYVQPNYTNGTTASHPRTPDISAPNDSATQGGRERGGQSEGLTPADLDRIMRRVESEAARMGVLVEDLLLLARLDQQRPLAHRPVDLLTLAADAVHDTRMLAPQRTVNLTVEPGAAFIVVGDEARLRQVIGNLMSNALTHTPEGTPVEVRISSGTLEPVPASPMAARPHPVPAVVLAVVDQGPGLTPEQTQRVFERFYRADQARTRTTGGSGLGLAIVSALVTAHGGTASVQSTPGRGATFRIVLPLAPEAQGTDDPQDQDADPEPAPPPYPAQRP
jgi:two-component system OmpR family sensor kinase